MTTLPRVVPPVNSFPERCRTLAREVGGGHPRVQLSPRVKTPNMFISKCTFTVD